MRALLAAHRIIRYLVAGGLAALAHLTTLTVLVELGGLRPLWASNVGFGVGLVVSYLLQRGWVFATSAAHLLTAPKFLTVIGAGLLLNSAVMHVGVDIVGLPYPLAQLIAFALLPINNYLLHSIWTFR